MALLHLDNSLNTSLDTISLPNVVPEACQPGLPLSTCSLYTDGSFHCAIDNSPPFMISAWLALDDYGYILESSSISLPSCFPSALRLEVYAVLLGIKTLSPGSSITIFTDCAQLISLWTSFVDAPFSPKLL